MTESIHLHPERRCPPVSMTAPLQRWPVKRTQVNKYLQPGWGSMASFGCCCCTRICLHTVLAIWPGFLMREGHCWFIVNKNIYCGTIAVSGAGESILTTHTAESTFEANWSGNVCLFLFVCLCRLIRGGFCLCSPHNEWKNEKDFEWPQDERTEPHLTSVSCVLLPTTTLLLASLSAPSWQQVCDTGRKQNVSIAYLIPNHDIPVRR